MINVNVLWIIFLILYVMSFVALIIFRFLLSGDNIEYSYKRNFPCEIITSGSKMVPTYKIFLFIFAGLSFAPLFCILPKIGEFGSIGWLAILISILYGFCGVFIAAIHIFEAKFIKVHSIIATIFFSLTMLSSALSAVFSLLVFQVNNRFNLGSASSMIYMGLFIAITLFTLIIVINPKLKEWTKLEKVKLPDGSLGYDRPKVFILALSEWVVILAAVVSELLFFLSLIKL